MNVRIDASAFRYFLVASWAAAAVSLAILLYSVFFRHLDTGAVTGVLWAASLLVALPEVFLLSRKGDGLDGWRVHTVFTLVSLSLLGLAACTWIQTGYDSSERDVFLGVVHMSICAVLVWGAYTAVNLVAFMSAYRGAPAGDQVPEPGPEAFEPSVPEAPAEEPEHAGYRTNMDIILSDIERFSSDAGGRCGIAVREDRGGK